MPTAELTSLITDVLSDHQPRSVDTIYDAITKRSDLHSHKPLSKDVVRQALQILVIERVVVRDQKGMIVQA